MLSEIFSNFADSEYAKREARLDEFDPSTLTPPFPKAGLVELSNRCNHACVFCANPRMQRKHGVLDIGVFERFVQEASAHGLEEIGLYTTGEPFFTKGLDRYVAIAKRAGIRYIFLTTNGALATPDRVVPVIEAGLSSIKFSVNAGSRETYKLVHGHDDFETVLENIRFIARYRQDHAPHLRLLASCVVTKVIEQEKAHVKELLLPLVDDLVFVGVDGQSGQALDQLVTLESTMSPPVPSLGKAQPCAMLWNRVHVTCEGYLTLCCVDYENALTYADLNVPGGLLDAWNNITITRMRARHKSQDLKGTLCHNCLYGTRDPVYPLTAIGHADATVPIEIGNENAASPIAARIAKLSDRRDQEGGSAEPARGRS